MPKFSLGLLNIVTHPHSPQQYVDLFEAAYGLNRVINMGGQTNMLVGYLTRTNDNAPLEGIEGVIHRYTEIDLNHDWLNTMTGKVAKQADLDEVNLPEHLKPHFKKFRFKFFPKRHLLSIIVKQTANLSTDGKPATLSISKAQEFFEKLLNDNVLRQTFPPADVKIVQDKEPLARIWRWGVIQKITLEINRPNTGGDTEREIEERLEAMNARKLQEVITADRNHTTGLTPTASLKNYCNVALKNGYVEADGIDDDRRVSIKTVEHPVEVTKQFSKYGSFLDTFSVASEAAVEDNG